MLEEEDAVDPESAFQFNAVLKEMQGIFHRKAVGEEDLSRLQSWEKNEVSKLNNNIRTVTSSCSETSSGETPSILHDEGETVFGGNKFCEEEQIKYEGGCDSERLSDGNEHHLYDEDGETGYHSMTTVSSSSDSSSLDSLSPSSTTPVDNVRAFASSYHFCSAVTTAKCPPLLKLPDKLLVDRILSLLGHRDLLRFSASCRRLQRLCWSTSLSLSIVINFLDHPSNDVVAKGVYSISNLVSLPNKNFSTITLIL